MSKWSKKYGKDHPECVMSGNEMIRKEMAKDIADPIAKAIREIRRKAYLEGFHDGVKSVGNK